MQTLLVDEIEIEIDRLDNITLPSGGLVFYRPEPLLDLDPNAGIPTG